MSDDILNTATARKPGTGIRPADLLTLPNDQRTLMRWLMRQQDVDLPTIVAHLNQDEAIVRSLLTTLVNTGLIQHCDQNGQERYRIRLATKSGRQMPKDIWGILDRKPDFANIFISYSRRDKAFVEMFHDALERQGRNVWVDWEGIPLATDWWEEIQRGIELADTFIAVLSPDSVQSKVCGQEIDYAVNHNKRLVPVVYRDVDPQAVHPALARLNWIFVRPQDNFEQALHNLTETLDTDLNYVRDHTRLTIRSLEWEEHDRDPSYLLRGKDLQAANQHLKEGEQKEPKPTALYTQYIFESTRAEAAQQEAALRHQSRSLQIQRLGLAFISILLLITAGLGLIGFNLARKADLSRKQAEKLQIKAQQAHLKALSRSSEALFTSHQLFEALKEGLLAASWFPQSGQKDPQLQAKIMTVLQNALFWIQERNHLEGHSGLIWDVTFSRDGTLLASSSADNTIRLWKPDGTLVKAIAGHGVQGTVVTFSPNSQTFVSTGYDGIIRLWQRDGTFIRILGQSPNPVTAVSISTLDGKIAVANERGQIQLRKVDGTLVQTLDAHAAIVREVLFSPDGQLLATADDGGIIKLWQRTPQGTFATQPQRVMTDHQGRVDGLSFSPNGQFLASASWDRTVRLWRRDGQLVRTITVQGNADQNGSLVYDVSFSPDGQSLAAATEDKRVYLWRLDGESQGVLIGHTSQVRSLSFSPDGQVLASAGGDRMVRLWQLQRPYLTPLLDHEAEVSDSDVSSDGQLIASASADHTIKLWSRQGKLLKTLRGHNSPVWDVDFDPTGQRLASASADHTIRLWDRSGKQLKILTGHGGSVNDLMFSPDGQFLVSGSEDGTLRLWTASGQFIRTFKGHKSGILSVAFSPNSKQIVSTSWDNTAKVWTVNGTVIATLSGHSGWVFDATYSPDGKMLATASYDNMVKLWDLNSYQVIRTLGGQGEAYDGVSWKGHEDGVSDLSFHPNGQVLASAGEDNTIRLWKLDGTLISILRGHQWGITSIDFSWDGQFLISTGNDHQILMWNLQDFDRLDVLTRRGCEWLKDYLHTNPYLGEDENQLCSSHSDQDFLSK